jgi:glutamate synthase (NADPH/NADH)
VYEYDETSENKTWASSLPVKQGLYDPELEKDACGVGFVANIKGEKSHKIVSDAKYLLCNMTHRGAVSSGGNGDGAGLSVAISHKFFTKEFKYLFNIDLPNEGQYSVANIFFNKDKEISEQSKKTFEEIANGLGLSVLAWREVPHDSSILGDVAFSREPLILQPVVVLTELLDNKQLSAEDFDKLYEQKFTRQLYLLKKQSSSIIGLHNWFYVCSLSNKAIVYKGQLTPVQVYNYYHDLSSADFESHFAVVHSRFSTNTFPSWARAHPHSFAIAHNGEINTLRGNKNWMKAREGVMESALFGEELDKLYPIIEEGGSDSAAIDNVLELLVINGVLTLPEAMMMLVPEAWENDQNMDSKKRAFYQWASCLMEPWDGPGLFTFTDGRFCGATSDRNGLRPCRYYVTSDDRIICGSEVGTIPDINDSIIIEKGGLEPGQMLLVDTKLGKIVDDSQLKDQISSKVDFKSWLSKVIKFEDLYQKYDAKDISFPTDMTIDPEIRVSSDPRLLAFGYTLEQVNLLLGPMALNAEEALGSMGNDSPLACLDENPTLIYDYFKQLFAQVTNPPIDPIREKQFMSLKCFIGPQGNLLEMNSNQCNRLLLESPVLDLNQFNALSNISHIIPSWTVAEIDITFPKSEGLLGYASTIERITKEASGATYKDTKIIVLTDRAVSKERVSVSSLIAVGAVHHHLIRQKQRTKVALILESAEAREVHHFAMLLGYGADGIFPYLAMETLIRMNEEGLFREEITDHQIVTNFKTSVDKGIYKIMSKMGISTLASYKGAQIFEALGIDNSVIDVCFNGTPSRIRGVTFEYIAQDAFSLHERGYPSRYTIRPEILPESGEYHWRDGASKKVNDPSAIAHLQDSVRNNNEHAFQAYVKKEMDAINDCTLRGLLELDYENSTEIPLEQVEPWTEIVRRFATGAMSFGSISMEAHSTIAIAMNRMNARSNTGEGGSYEDIMKGGGELENNDSIRAAIKQVASGRFGVTSHYLSDADEIQIKMAQGAKSGEGGELKGSKVNDLIAQVRNSTTGVGLISPPPHHDIYSIEDLKQLIYDLKCSNPRAEISVKLVSEVGVGIVASGVAKAKADRILISGHDGGTGAAKWTSIKYTGLPWELGLAETHQTLVLNDLRGNVVLQTDGQVRTPFDVAVGLLLGAESFTLATIPLITLGCIMMRKCHLNTCPVGIATQDPELRKKFQGAPEHVINFFYYLTNDLRKIMAKLGFRTIDEMVGHSEKLKAKVQRSTKTCNIDLTPILTPAHSIRPGVATRYVHKQDHKLHVRLDNKLIDEAEITLDKGLPVTIDGEISNTDRAVGSTLSYRISKKFGSEGLPQDTVVTYLKGSAGQSFGAFLTSGVTFHLEGDANDYVGKGMSGGRIIIKPPKGAQFKAHENVIVGNTCFYGATSGYAFISGAAGERFAVRNSGANIVVEKIKGNNAFEYMTRGRAIVLSQMESDNAFAGCSGGIIYVLTSDYKEFSSRINAETVELSGLTDPVEIAFVKGLIEEHLHYTESELAGRILKNFNHYLSRFVKVLPTEYKAVLEAEQKKVSQLKRQESESFLRALKGIDTPPVSDATNGEIERLQKATTPITISNKAAHKEPKILDLEDTVKDKDNEKKKVEKLDKLRGFMKYKRRHEHYRSPGTRSKDWKEISSTLTKKEAKYETARCMDCGIPFCQSDTGCPLSNVIPKFNELVFKDQWKLALDKLLETNPFPEFLRACPAPCMEGGCTLGIIDEPVGIKSIERLIIDNAFANGWIVPKIPQQRTGKRIAVIGSGPAGLAAADQLNKAGHLVTVYERSDRPGGLLMYGIPNMKLDKFVVKRRLALLEAEGIEFIRNTEVDDVAALQKQYDAVVLAIGSTIPRDLKIPGRELNNVDFAMTLLKNNTQALLDDYLPEIHDQIAGKNVIVIGGGDTGNDCIGTAVRHGAKSVVNFELLPQPPNVRSRDNPWPQWPRIFRVDYGHTEVREHYGKDPREYCILSKEFLGDGDGNVIAIKTVRVEWKKSESGVWQMNEIPNSEETFDADLVLLSMGFVGPEIGKFEIQKSSKGTIPTINNASHKVKDNLFAAGDCRRGQSLIVWGLQEGKQCAREVDMFLEGNSRLPGTGGIIKRDFRLLEELAQGVEQAA